MDDFHPSPSRGSMPSCSRPSGQAFGGAEEAPSLTAARHDGARNLRSGRKNGSAGVEQKNGPGGEHERFWLEEVVAVGNDGGKPLFSWGFGPLTREG
jgi:hypothetical protein